LFEKQKLTFRIVERIGDGMAGGCVGGGEVMKEKLYSI
jgi:hypothetical protein